MYIPPKQFLKPTKVVAGCIAIFENAWENPEKAIQVFESVANNKEATIKFEKAKQIVDSKDFSNEKEAIVSNYRSNYSLDFQASANENDEVRKLYNYTFELTYSAVGYYADNLASTVKFYFHELPSVLRYQTGEEYKAHFDGGTDSKRALSPIIYLNDNYEGGEIEFVNFDIKLKPKAGMLILFPSNYAYAHIAHPVKTGTKYAIVNFLHDQP